MLESFLKRTYFRKNRKLEGVTRQHVEEDPSYIFMVKPTSSIGFWKNCIRFKFELVPISAKDHYKKIGHDKTDSIKRKNLFLQVRMFHLWQLYSLRGDIGSPQDIAQRFKDAKISDYIDIDKCEVFDTFDKEKRIWDPINNMGGLDYNNVDFFETFMERWQAQRRVANGEMSEREFYRDNLEQESFYNQWVGNRKGFTSRLSRFLDPSKEEIPEVWKSNIVRLTDEQWWRIFVKFYVRGGKLQTIDEIISFMTRS